MRTGGCTVQQALTAEAATVVKQAVTLATLRAHAQVTPLHVANTMLASSSGLLRTACLQSPSHPLQCKALELCFNVALNRLPASTSSPMLGPHCHQPCPQISNALVAAFKRAQAHQRRGSIENQQQPLLAVKIELDQLIISILDDPSVSRVMREAGFSSTQVKSNIEQAVSLEICSQSAPSVSSTKSKESNNVLVLSQSPGSQAGSKSIPNKPMDPIRDEDVMSVVESLMDKRRRSIVIVGECVGTIEGVVKAVMDKVHKGDVPEVLSELRFETLPILPFGQYLSRFEVENKLEEVKGLVRIHRGKGVVLNVGDLKWAIDSNINNNGGGFLNHLIMELGKLACGIRESNGGKFWLMGIATFQTYMKCKSCHPSLEIVWGLHPLTVLAGSLRFSLTVDSDVQSHSTSNKVENGSSNWTIVEGHSEVITKQLTCCADCSAKFESEARALQSSACNSPDSTTSNLPAWLQQYKNENKAQVIRSNDQDCVSIKDLCKKWNSFCSSVHHQLQQPYSSEKTLTTFSSLSPSSSISIFSNDHHQTHHHDWPMNEPKQHSWRDHQPHFWNFGSDNLNNKDTTTEPTLRMCISPQPFSSNINHGSTTPNSTSSSELMEMENYLHKFKELNAENLKTLCNALEKKVPWQKDIIPDIASTILQCRSGMVRRKVKLRSGNDQAKEETWFFFQGVDIKAKEKIARELARLVFGTQNDFVSISLSSFSSTRADSTEDYCRNKRSRDDQSCSYIEKFAEAVSSNPHRVFFIEDVEQADYFSQMGFKRAIERGKISKSIGEEVGLSDAIIILSCESFSSRSRACSPQVRHKIDEEDHKNSSMEDTVSPSVSLDLNISIEDDKVEDDESIDDIGLLESADRRIVFKLQEL